jgi:hypothetical protein
MVLPRRPMARRRAEPAPSPAPARRAEPEAAPAKKAGPNTIRALVVDPQAKTVREIRLKTSPGDEANGYGAQLDEPAVEKLVGVEDLESIDVGDGQVVIADELRQGQGESMEWTLGEAAEPIAGVGVIVSYDADSDAYADAMMTLDEARAAVTWGDDGEDNAGELRAAIAERLDAMDAAQLQKLQASLDEAE